ncbi:M23 family metallopeptidase [Candidatus Vampirococcus lugosii]|uniref:M23ase beta-sheet core domain-containing protein n=1 Tax=Candidatus Vampirococcus lugosii TaxID=2789015 RepID=A0ABS5QNP9_9BACT|nr:M23 family metallopeptidase [Candidatus Vampirococcus lugosii]MBS8122044.1 hypothetical protein [Candidatus Vampirococcus lugosii]
MKNIKTKKINKNNGVIFYKKVLSLSIFFTAGIYIFNIPLGNNFLANISDYGLGLLTNQEILENVDNIKDNSVVWPLRQVTDRSKVVNYEKTKNTDWKDLENNLKTPFPNKFSDTIEKYKFVSPYNIWATITNPLEREKVIFYKRLITTLWTTSYSCSLESCDRWIPNTGTHAGIDIVSSTGTPVYNSMNGIVMRKQSGNTGFGNYLVILTNFNGELLATFYAHFDDFHGNIKEGDIIKKMTTNLIYMKYMKFKYSTFTFSNK